MPVTYPDIDAAFADTGLVVRGGFRTTSHEDPADKTIILVGNVGPDMWRHFSSAPRSTRDPLDTWTRSIVGPRADKLGAVAIHPNDKPYRPFQQWAMRAEAVSTSPLGILIHPDFGLWHAYRAALLFDDPVTGVPVKATTASPCNACETKPCLNTCPVGAFTSARYDVPKCVDHLRTPNGGECHEAGCLARLACPVAQEQQTPSAQRKFHTAAFFQAQTNSN